MKDYLNYDGLAVMAHRGGSLEAPENTIESFKYALEIGSDIIETDIQLSSDGIPYIFHDDDLKRIHGIDERISVENYKTMIAFYYQLILNSSI